MLRILQVDLCEKNQLTLHIIQSSYMYLKMITVSEIIKLKWPHKTTLYETEDEPQKQHFLEQLVEFYYEVTSGTHSLPDVQSSPLVREVSEIFLGLKNYLQTFRNSTLWLKYTDMVDILGQFVDVLRSREINR